MHYVPGEHDFIDEEVKLYKERYGRGTKGAGWYSFDAGGVHFVGLVNVVNLKAGGLGNLGNDTRPCRWRSSATRVDDVREAVAAGADLVLLDNMTPAEMAEAVAATAGGRCGPRRPAGSPWTRPRAVAATGVDYISVGALTHSAKVLDIALDLRDG